MGGHVQQDLVDQVWFYKRYYIFFLRQNQQQSGIIQIYYGIIVNVCICDNNDENNSEPIHFYLGDGRNNPGEASFQKQYS